MILALEQSVNDLKGRPVGISFKDGQGTSGVLCGIEGSKLLLIEYLYHQQFALKQYDIFTIRKVNEFPPCP